MKKDKDSFDLYLSIKIKECAEDIPVPKHSEDETWLGIKKELEAKKHKQTIIAKRMVVFCKREFPIFAKIFPQAPVGNFYVNLTAS